MTSGQSDIGCENPVCPYCGVVFDKMPGRKKKCPVCGAFIFVRTRPSDRKRVLVTEAQAAEIEAQWSAHHHQVELSRLDEPGLTADQQWAKCNSDLMTHSVAGNWGLFCSTRLHMANILHREGRLKAALQTYLEVCYLDVGGPNNLGGLSDPVLLRELPPFDPKLGFLAPAVVDWVFQVSSALSMDLAAVEQSFLDVATATQTRLRVPVAPAEAWRRVGSELEQRGV